MDVLALHGVLFSGAAAGERFDERVRNWGKGRRAFAGPYVSAAGFDGAAAGGGAAEHHRVEYREVAAECGRSGDVRAAAGAGGLGGAGVFPQRVGDALYRGQCDADVELGYSEFLVADCVRVYGAGTGFGDERRGARSAADAAEGRVWCGGD